MNPLLIIDTNYLCHRAFHSVGNLSHEDVGTGTVYGVLRDIINLLELHKTNRCVLAFDSSGDSKSLRQKILPSYKSSRAKRYEEESEEEHEARISFRKQVKNLRDKYLPEAGFQNVFWAPGYEADDVIARVTRQLPYNQEGIIVATDQDLWQCIDVNIWCWNPQTKKGCNINSFVSQWGIEPHQWAEVKALAGCKTDDIPGIPGVGEKTAAKYISGALKSGKAYDTLVSKEDEFYDKNIKLTKLPFPGTPEFVLRNDTITEEKWQALADSLGMRSIRDAVPYATKRKSKGRKRAKEGFWSE